MCLIDFAASTSHAKVPSKAPSTGLSRKSSKTYFLSHNYCEQNKTARSDIYQQHRHLNQPLDQKLNLHPQATEGFHGGHVGGLKQFCMEIDLISQWRQKCIVFALQHGDNDVT